MYPDEFQVAVNGPLPKEIVDEYLLSSSLSSEDSPFDENAFSLRRRFTFDILLTSTANILGLLRFEFRVLRFFNDVCVPFMTYNVNRRHSVVWEVVVPQYVTKSPAIRLAILAMGCLNIMPVLGLDKLIEDNMDENELARKLEAGSDSMEVQKLFADDYLLEEESEVNLFRHASEFFSDAVHGVHRAVAHLLDPNISYSDRILSLSDATISSYLIYSFLGLHPWKMLPLVHFPEEGEEPRADMLSIAAGMKTVIMENREELRSSDIGELFHMDELQFVFRLKVKLVEELKSQFNDYLHGINFLDINPKINDMIQDIRECLALLDKVCSLSIKFNYPVLVFKWLPMVGPELIPHIRAKEPFALRVLFVYACLCVYYRFWAFEHNVWKDFILWYRDRYGPLCDFDERLYHYVIVKRKYINAENYYIFKDFDVWSSEFDYDSAILTVELTPFFV